MTNFIMKIKIISKLKEEWQKIINHPLRREDKRIFIEALILVCIYFASFLILSLGRVQQELFGISANSISTIQLTILTFIFAFIIAYIIYQFIYKKVIEWE